MTITACGTDAGYRLHRSKNQDACRACLNAHSAYNRLRRREPSPDHGTAPALRRHAVYNSPVCDACLALADHTEREKNARFLTQYRITTAGMPMEDAS